MHWWAEFELGIHFSVTSTYYNLIIFASAVFIIAIMLMKGARVNKQKLTHEFYMEKISEEKQKQAEKRAKEQQKAAAAAKMETNI
jgi:predicted tellurium resistance membrane protein TerC